MSPPAIIPAAKCIYLCDNYLPVPDHKIDLRGVFNSIRPKRYPHIQNRFAVFAQLIGGLGNISFHLDIDSAATGQQIYTTGLHVLAFPTRTTVAQLAYSIQRCLFPNAGRYLVQLYCESHWVADASRELL